MSGPPSPTLSSTSSFLPTTTLLAIPDGPIASSSKDARSHLTSILGGYPTFPPLPATSSSSPLGSTHPKPEEITCGSCGNQIPLLTQVYCPPEGGENDRNVYVFACPRGACQRKGNSVRAYRASVRNEVYAADAAEQKAKREKEEAEKREKDKINPFSMSSPTLAGGGLGSTLFGGSADGMPTFNPFSTVAASSTPTEAFAGLSLGSEAKKEEEEDELKSAAVSGPEMPGRTFGAPFPAYMPPQYLTTFDEYLPADPNALAGDTAGRVRQMSAQEAEEKEKELQAQASKKGAGASSGGGGAAGGEQWEKVLPKGVDEVFERFLERLNRAEDGSGQVLRYDLGAVPLPYSSDSDLFKRLFKRDAEEGAQDEDDLAPDVNVFGKKYDPTGVVPACPRCGGKRTFEMQLVPGLIAELKTEKLCLTSSDKKRRNKKKKTQQTDEERRRELAVLLGRTSAKDLPRSTTEVGAGEDERTPEEREEDRLRAETGMEWGTIMVFGCERDCVGFGEEWVGVEWEDVQ